MEHTISDGDSPFLKLVKTSSNRKTKVIKMRFLQSIIAIAVSSALVLSASAFSLPSASDVRPLTRSMFILAATADVAPAMASSGVPPAHSDASEANVAEAEIPTNLPSAVGKDYVPLATMLATGELAEADQVCGMSAFESSVTRRISK